MVYWSREVEVATKIAGEEGSGCEGGLRLDEGPIYCYVPVETVEGVYYGEYYPDLRRYISCRMETKRMLGTHHTPTAELSVRSNSARSANFPDRSPCRK